MSEGDTWALQRPLVQVILSLCFCLLFHHTGVHSQLPQPRPYLETWTTILGGIQKLDSSIYTDQAKEFLMMGQYYSGADGNNTDEEYDNYNGEAKHLVIKQALNRARKQSNILLRAGQLSSIDVCPMFIEFGVTPKCCEDTKTVLTSISKKEIWALQMLDSFGKIPSGIMLLNTHFVGSYHECLNVSVAVRDQYTGHSTPHRPFRPKYCQTVFPINNKDLNALSNLGLTVGLCSPDSCSPRDINILVNMSYHLLPFHIPKNQSTFSYCDTRPEVDGKAIFSIVFCSLFLVLLLSATIYDVVCHQGEPCSQKLPIHHNMEHSVGEDSDKFVDPVNEGTISDPDGTDISCPPSNEDLVTLKPVQLQNKAGLAGRILLCFSVYRNSAKLFNTTQAEGNLSSVHGVRFLSMSWVLLGHVYAFMAMSARNPLAMADFMKGFAFQAIVNAFVSVDSFFLLSGLLVSYSTLRAMRANDGKMNWLYFYIHRYWRLTPPYILLMMVQISLFRYLGSGPFWPAQGVEYNFCRDSWYYNLLYINNFMMDTEKKSCMAWSWYLANDMQFYWISPLFIVPLYKSAKVGHVVTLLALLGHIITTALIVQYLHAPMIQLVSRTDIFNDIYVKPYARIGPYLIGILYGYHLYNGTAKKYLNGYISAVLWSLATISAVSVLYGIYNVQNGATVTEGVSIFYNAVNRTVWGLCVGWVILACTTGYGGVVNKILSMKVIVPISRLTYCAYLVHPLIIFYYNLTQLHPLTASHINAVFLFCGELVITFTVSYVLSMAFEAPMMGLEKVLRESLKNKRK